MNGLIGDAYNEFEGSEVMREYARRHGIESLGVLTVTDDETAHLIASHLEPRVRGKTVVEVGGGVGLLALHLGMVAKRVFCIEANPAWSMAFQLILLGSKPKNVSYLFGAADEFAGLIKGDVALFCTHSGVDSLKTTAALFAPVVIDVYGEIIASDPDAFDKEARELREKT